jgi:hypothetical protein
MYKNIDKSSLDLQEWMKIIPYGAIRNQQAIIE